MSLFFLLFCLKKNERKCIEKNATERCSSAFFFSLGSSASSRTTRIIFILRRASKALFLPVFVYYVSSLLFSLKLSRFLCKSMMMMFTSERNKTCVCYRVSFQSLR